MLSSSLQFNPLLFARNVFGLDQLGQEILQVAVPAALALAADPLASLVDTAFIGRLGLLIDVLFPVLLLINRMKHRWLVDCARRLVLFSQD